MQTSFTEPPDIATPAPVETENSEQLGVKDMHATASIAYKVVYTQTASGQVPRSTCVLYLLIQSVCWWKAGGKGMAFPDGHAS